MVFLKLSIKHFIGDLPNIINANFEKIRVFVENIFDENTRTLKSTNAEFAGKMSTNSIVTKNLTVDDKSGKQVTFAELIERLEKLEATVSTNTTNGIDTYAAAAASAMVQTNDKKISRKRTSK